MFKHSRRRNVKSEEQVIWDFKTIEPKHCPCSKWMVPIPKYYILLIYKLTRPCFSYIKVEKHNDLKGNSN